MAAECQMSKCRARCRLIVEKLRNPETKAPKGRYRFTPPFLGRDTGCGKPFQFRFRFSLHVEKHGKSAERRKNYCFTLLAPP